MAQAIRYLNTDLGTGDDTGLTPENAWRTWNNAITGVNASHPDMVTATEGVDVMVSGSMESITPAGQITFSSVSNETYPLRFIASGGTPAIWDVTKPGLFTSGTYSSSAKFLINPANTQRWIEFIGLNFEFFWNRYLFQCTSQAAAGSAIVFRGCYVKGPETGSSSRAFYIGLDGTYAPVIAENCIFEDFLKVGSGFCPIFEAGANGCEFLNCTVINCTDNNFLIGSNTTANWRVTNTLFNNSGTARSGAGGMAAGTGKNATNQTSAERTLLGSDNTYEASFSFVSSTDRHLTEANTWGAGPEDGTYGEFVPTTDIDGDTRSGATTSAGADEVVASGGPTPPHVSVSIR